MATRLELDTDGDDFSEEGTEEYVRGEKDENSCKGFCCYVVTSPLWCGVTTVCVLLAIVLIVVTIMKQQGEAQVTLEDNLATFHSAEITPPEWPRYMDCSNGTVDICLPKRNKSWELIEYCNAPCFGLKLVQAWDKLAHELPWKEVMFPSRPGPKGEPPVKISAWWLPADTSRFPPDYVPPRVVLQHGLKSNNNHCGVQVVAYMLRSMGIDCLAPTIRDYGLSGVSSHPETMTWAYDYPADLLGAWDLAVNDPQNELGGPIPAAKVGIQGFSKGALISAIAFGLETRIRTAWIDSAPWGGLKQSIQDVVASAVGPLAPPISAIVYTGAEEASPVHVDYYDPFKLLGNCADTYVKADNFEVDTRRKVMLAQATNDDIVSFQTATKKAIEELGGEKECFKVRTWTPTEDCNGQHHHVEYWQHPTFARKELCAFWFPAFNMSTSLCHLDELPDLS